MQVETKYLCLRQEIALGEEIDGWKVYWRGGWGRDRLFYFVMVARVKIDPAWFTECAQRCAAWEEESGAEKERRKRGWRENEKETTPVQSQCAGGSSIGSREAGMAKERVGNRWRRGESSNFRSRPTR